VKGSNKHDSSEHKRKEERMYGQFSCMLEEKLMDKEQSTCG